MNANRLNKMIQKPSHFVVVDLSSWSCLREGGCWNYKEVQTITHSHSMGSWQAAEKHLVVDRLHHKAPLCHRKAFLFVTADFSAPDWDSRSNNLSLHYIPHNFHTKQADIVFTVIILSSFSIIVKSPSWDLSVYFISFITLLTKCCKQTIPSWGLLKNVSVEVNTGSKAACLRFYQKEERYTGGHTPDQDHFRDLVRSSHFIIFSALHQGYGWSDDIIEPFKWYKQCIQL